METPAQQCTRLLTALGELVTEESMLIGAGDYAAVVNVVERAGPLVDRIATLAPVAGRGARQQATAVIAQRNRNQAQLATQLAHTEEGLRELKLVGSRIGQIVPAYRSATPAKVPRRLSAQG